LDHQWCKNVRLFLFLPLFYKFHFIFLFCRHCLRSNRNGDILSVVSLSSHCILTALAQWCPVISAAYSSPLHMQPSHLHRKLTYNNRTIRNTGLPLHETWFPLQADLLIYIYLDSVYLSPEYFKRIVELVT